MQVARALIAMGFLIPALILLKLADAICPETRQRQGMRPGQAPPKLDSPWLDAAEDWDNRVH